MKPTNKNMFMLGAFPVIFFLAMVLAAGCSEPAPVAKVTTTVVVDVDPAKTPVVDTCSAGKYVQRTNAGWICVDVPWSQVTDKPTEFLPTAHHHLSADITDFAGAMTLNGMPFTSIRGITSTTFWPGKVSWDSVINKLTRFPPDFSEVTLSDEWRGSVQWGQIINQPSIFPSAPHLHDFSDITGVSDTIEWRGTSNWSRIINVPAEFSPVPHMHLWEGIVDRPTAMTPVPHDQAFSTINGLTATTEWPGTIVANRVTGVDLAALAADVASLKSRMITTEAVTTDQASQIAAIQAQTTQLATELVELQNPACPLNDFRPSTPASTWALTTSQTSGDVFCRRSVASLNDSSVGMDYDDMVQIGRYWIDRFELSTCV